jgi:hypothetical protein
VATGLFDHEETESSDRRLDLVLVDPRSLDAARLGSVREILRDSPPGPGTTEFRLVPVTRRGTVAHAASRLARVIIAVVESESDPRTLSGWSRITYAAPGTLRNWCRTAGVSARQCLVFARLLRVLVASGTGTHRPENLLDVADRRTITCLARYAGFATWDDVPRGLQQYLDCQCLIRDHSIIEETRACLVARGMWTGDCRPTLDN